MKVFIITGVPFPGGMAATNRIMCLAKALQEKGIVCQVIVFHRESSNNDYPAEGSFEGISYKYIGEATNRAKGRICGKLQSLYLKIALLFYLQKTISAKDVVLAYHKEDNKLRNMILKIIHQRNAFYIHELCEYPFIALNETSKVIKNREYELKHLFPQYDGVIAISENLVQLAKQHCSNQCHIIKIPILVDFEKYNLPDNSSQAQTPYIFHSGTLTEQKDGILGMIRAFGEAGKRIDKPLKFVITGHLEKSPHKKEIAELIEQYDLQERIEFTGFLSKEDLRTKLSEASLVIINKYPSLQNQYCFSTKLGEYMAAGKPVIITNVGEATNWLTDKENAFIIEHSNNNQLVEAIIYAATHANEVRKIGENGKLLCKSVFDYKAYSALLYDYVNGFSSNQL